MNGAVFVQKFRGLPGFESSVLALMSGNRGATEQAATLGFDTVLPKPLRVASLVVMISTYCGPRRGR
jgi:hypothetical protein